MKKHKKPILISLGALALVTTIGGNVMAINYLNNRFDAYVKARKEIREKEERMRERKRQEEEQAVRDEQLAYLKENQQEIEDFVKSQSPKVESVQIDWTDVRWSESGLFESEYYIDIYGTINHIEDSSWGASFPINDDDTVDVDDIVLFDDITIGDQPI